MTVPSTVPATKPEPVRLLGSVITGLTVITGGLGLVAGLQDNATLATILGVAALVIAGINAAKDEYVRSQVIPAADVTAYINDDHQEVVGEASAAPTGAVIQTITGELVGDGLTDPSDPSRDVSRLDLMDGVGRPDPTEH